MHDNNVYIKKPMVLLTKDATNEVEDIELVSISNNRKLDLSNDIKKENLDKLYGVQIKDNNQEINSYNDDNDERLEENITDNIVKINLDVKTIAIENKTNYNTNINTITKPSKKSINKEGIERKKLEKNKKTNDKTKEKDKKDKDKDDKAVKFADDKSTNNFNTTNNLHNTNNNTNTIRKRVKFKNPIIEYVNIESYKLYNSLMCFSDPHFDSEPKPTKCKCSIL
jgi:hypothetical protein